LNDDKKNAVYLRISHIHNVHRHQQPSYCTPSPHSASSLRRRPPTVGGRLTCVTAFVRRVIVFCSISLVRGLAAKCPPHMNNSVNRRLHRMLILQLIIQTLQTLLKRTPYVKKYCRKKLIKASFPRSRRYSTRIFQEPVRYFFSFTPVIFFIHNSIYIYLLYYNVIWSIVSSISLKC